MLSSPSDPRIVQTRVLTRFTSDNNVRLRLPDLFPYDVFEPEDTVGQFYSPLKYVPFSLISSLRDKSDEAKCVNFATIHLLMYRKKGNTYNYIII